MPEELVKIRMLRTSKELVSGAEWTTFVKGEEYEVPARISRNLLGVKACKLVTVDLPAVIMLPDLSDNGSPAVVVYTDGVDDEVAGTEGESKMDGPPENKAAQPPQNKAGKPKPRKNGKRKNGKRGKRLPRTPVK